MALKSCCCCRLREGSLSIGIIFLVLTILGIFCSIPNWLQLAEDEAALEEYHRFHPNGTDTAERLNMNITVTESDVSSAEHVRLTRVQVVCTALEMVLALVFNSLLIHGVRRSVPVLLLAWLVYYVIIFVIFSLGGVALIIFGILIAAAGTDQDPFFVKDAGLVPMFSALFAVGGLVVLGMAAFMWYLWVVVFSYHRELRDRSEGVHKRDVLMEDRPPAYRPVPQSD